jgi:hypothetical protein
LSIYEYTSALNTFSELLQPGRHRLIRVLAALLALAPLALVLADAPPPAFLAAAPLALVRADARPPALLACAPDALVRADARPPAVIAFVPDALVLSDARPPALLALVPGALVLADARLPALLACAPLVIVLADARPLALLAWAPLSLLRADTARPLRRGAPRRVGLFAHPPLACNFTSWICRRAPHLQARSSPEPAAGAAPCAPVLIFQLPKLDR